jgi:hypothetical protein
MFIGYIYKITGACGKVYIGSTNNFRKRKNRHNSKTGNTSSSKLLERPLQFEIIRTTEYNTIRIMNLMEQFYIDLNSSVIVNDRRAFVNYKQRREQKLKDGKKYREKHKEKIIKYREDNKEEIKKRRTKKVICECGCIINSGSVYRHKKTKKHINLLNN